jgi:mRNA-degrading endonuclease RelE of RelBE toxin-antitoxin system
VTCEVTYTPRARRALSVTLPEAVAAACIEFIGRDLAENPHRVGKALRAPLAGLHSARRGSFRVLYRIDDEQVMVLVVTIDHRRDVYRA